MQSKRFIIVSFFVTLALSALCQSAYDVIKLFSTQPTVNGGLRILYAVGLTCFLIKYFIDDVVDDSVGQGEPISRRSLSSLIIAWMMFIFAALSAGVMEVSAVFWLCGIVVITWFMCRNRSLIPTPCFRRYFAENVSLSAFLVGVAMPKLAANLAQSTSYIAIVVGGLFLLNAAAFVTMLSDGREAR